ncbi:glycosyltransferase family 4 protein [Microbacterium testaceum]|uniref:glycosyltransferase family 4 protein n=1 Tax=Microbacterium testaceum TaxID=2033 RepID=UPI001D170531|nr:glycosyltransferase family 4 protein [Microbacterium testaceum]MCC4249433.1 glycosyltransferase family 4 protein [Microbacterium testaceum]
MIAQYTSALDAFRSAGAAKRVLLYPIAHHRWMRDFLGQEAERNPDWAPFLQGHDILGEDEADLDSEIELADLIIVPSSFARDTFIQAGVAGSRIRVVPLGTDISTIPQATRTDRFTVMFAGQLNQRKGISYLLDAFDRAQIPEARLVLIGGAGEDIRTHIRRNYPHVDIQGTRPRWKLKLAMAEADVLVMPSLAEGFGLVALEAMSVGTPAIVTPHTFGGDVITDGIDGWTTPVGQSEDLARLLASVASDREQLARVSDAAVATSHRFSWDEYGSRAMSAIGVVR